MLCKGFLMAAFVPAVGMLLIASPGGSQPAASSEAAVTQVAQLGFQGSGGDTCYETVPCVAPRCIPIPTSLQPVGRQPDPDGWRGPEEGSCGIRRCYIIWVCPCGPPLATEACL